MSLKFSFKLFKIKLRLPQRASTTPELPGPLSGPWTPAARDFALRARDVRFAHIFCSFRQFFKLDNSINNLKFQMLAAMLLPLVLSDLMYFEIFEI